MLVVYSLLLDITEREGEEKINGLHMFCTRSNQQKRDLILMQFSFMCHGVHKNFILLKSHRKTALFAFFLICRVPFASPFLSFTSFETTLKI